MRGVIKVRLGDLDRDALFGRGVMQLGLGGILSPSSMLNLNGMLMCTILRIRVAVCARK